MNPDAEPRSSGLVHALWTLAKPAVFDPLEPTVGGVAYAEPRSGIPPLYDVYLPDDEGPHPSVIVVHGGGFVVGHRRMKPVRLLATRLCRAGYAVCAIDYRLLFRGGGIEAQLEDVRAAATHWRESCEAHGCNPHRISMLGLSAGAALMMLHAGRHEAEYHRLVSIYAPTDFMRVSGRRARWLLRLVMGTDDADTWRERSPLHHATMASPLLIVHGTDDALVPVNHSVRLHEARRGQGLPSELDLVPGMRHGWLNDATLPETDYTVRRVVDFLNAEA